MRSAFLALIAAVALGALSVTAQAAPVAPHGLSVSNPAVTMVRGGCGPGWHPRAWRDRWGRWHRRCVPNGY